MAARYRTTVRGTDIELRGVVVSDAKLQQLSSALNVRFGRDPMVVASLIDGPLLTTAEELLGLTEAVQEFLQAYDGVTASDPLTAAVQLRGKIETLREMVKS